MSWSHISEKFLFFHGINERYMQLKSKQTQTIKKRLDNEFYRLVDPNVWEFIKGMFITNQKIKLDSFK